MSINNSTPVSASQNNSRGVRLVLKHKVPHPQSILQAWWGGGGEFPYKGLMRAASQGMLFGDFCLTQGIDFVTLS